MSPRFVLLRSQSDERLVGLARAGNERAFAAIVERYSPELQALARRLCSDGRSEDVVQQAFLSAFTALSTGSEVRHLRGWLYQIVRNAATRPAGPLCVPLDQAAASLNSVDDVVQQRALAMTTLAELARLPDRQRQAMIGTALDGRARAEVASSMGLSEGAVRQLVHRARTTLRSAVTAVTPWPVARWLVAIRPDMPGSTELAAGAGAASSGGLAIKLGALLASGTLLTGVAVELGHLPAPRAGARTPTTPALHVQRHGARSLAAASLAGPALAAREVAQPRAAARLGVATERVAHAGPGAARVQLGPTWHAQSLGSAVRSNRQRLGVGDGNAGRPGHGGSSSSRGGQGDGNQRSAGSDSGRPGGNQGAGGSDGGGGGHDSIQASAARATTGSDQGPSGQMLSGSQSLPTNGGSSSDWQSGSSSGSGATTQSGSGSGSGSGTYSGSGSGSGTDTGSGSWSYTGSGSGGGGAGT